MWILQKFSLTLSSQKSRENNGFTKEITKYLIWRNFFQWERIARFSTLCRGIVSWQFFKKNSVKTEQGLKIDFTKKKRIFKNLFSFHSIPILLYFESLCLLKIHEMLSFVVVLELELELREELHCRGPSKRPHWDL